MEEPLDELYFKWLYGQVASVKYKNPARTYWSLLRQLYQKEYIWLVPNDDNRVEDGRDLRHEFINKTRVVPTQEWLNLGCSMLEMLIGLSRRLAFEDDADASIWFWKLLDNVELRQFSDREYHDLGEIDVFFVVDDILDQVIFRTYDENGHGGLFPLQFAAKDQRKVEIWYQMATYLLE